MHHADGIILCSIENEWEMLNSYLSYGKLIACNEYNEDQSVSMIRAKQYEGFYKATEYLLSKEKRGIAYCTGRKGFSTKDTLELLRLKSRDNPRTPMQWSTEKNAGFTTGTPWLKVNDNYTEINMETQDTDPDSVLNYYRKLIALRKSPAYKEVFAYGEFLPVYQNTSSVMAYYRKTENQRILITANFGKEAVSLTLEYPVKQILLSNMASAEHSLPANDIITLNSCEVLVFELETL